MHLDAFTAGPSSPQKLLNSVSTCPSEISRWRYSTSGSLQTDKQMCESNNQQQLQTTKRGQTYRRAVMGSRMEGLRMCSLILSDLADCCIRRTNSFCSCCSAVSRGGLGIRALVLTLGAPALTGWSVGLLKSDLGSGSSSLRCLKTQFTCGQVCVERPRGLFGEPQTRNQERAKQNKCNQLRGTQHFRCTTLDCRHRACVNNYCSHLETVLPTNSNQKKGLKQVNFRLINPEINKNSIKMEVKQNVH